MWLSSGSTLKIPSTLDTRTPAKLLRWLADLESRCPSLAQDRKTMSLTLAKRNNDKINHHGTLSFRRRLHPYLDPRTSSKRLQAMLNVLFLAYWQG